jgi:hypothetical protein
MTKDNQYLPDVKGFFDEDSNTVSYVVSDLTSGKAAISTRMQSLRM